jgi:predicted RNA-binding protein Jag
MNPYERRQVHLALKDDGEISTVSRGDGYIKRVSIVHTSSPDEAEKQD